MAELLFSGRRWELTKAAPSDAVYVGGHVRSADRLEVAASGQFSPVAAALSSLDGSLCSFAVRCGGVTVAVFGVARGTLLSDEFVCWMLASKELEECGTAFARYSRRTVEALAERYPVMRNYVGAWNVRTLRWLRWCGFEVSPPRRLGVHGELLHPVVYRRKEG